MKAWIKRHPVWSSIIGVFVLLTVIGAASGDPSGKKQSGEAARAAATETSTASALAAETATATPTPKPEPHVRLSVHPGKQTTVHAPQVRIAGGVTRGAKVSVRGRRVPVSHGRYATTIALKRGRNLVTVAGSKHGYQTTKTSVEFTRKLSAAEKAAVKLAREQAAAAKIANYKASATGIPYNQLNKDADRYRGKRVRYTGQILQIQEDGNLGGFMLLSVTNEGYGIYDDNIWVDYDHHVKSAEDDIVTVYGTVTGSKSYETQIGGETYVPQMHARYIDE